MKGVVCGVVIVVALWSGCTSCSERLVASEAEQSALKTARAIPVGINAHDLQLKLGLPTYQINRVSDGEVVRLAGGGQAFGTRAEIQGRYGCRTIANWRSAGEGMWTYDLVPTVRLCVYFDQQAVVEKTVVIWH